MNTSFILHPVPPFRLDYTVWALRRRAENIIDRWDGKHYMRLLLIEEQPIKVTLKQKNNLNKPKIFVNTNKRISKKIQRRLSLLLEMMFSLNRNMYDFYQAIEHDPHLKPLVIQFMGVKPPRFPSMFEAMVNAISCQQISLDAGLQIQNRLVQHAGASIQAQNNIFYAFPTPKNIASCSILELKKLGYSKHKSEALIQLASAIVAEKILFDDLENKSTSEAIRFLCQFKGIGRWSAEYVLLRGLGKTEIFPGDDVGAQRNLQQLLHLDKKLDYQNVLAIIKKWYPYAGVIYFHLLLYKLNKKGLLQSSNIIKN